MAGLVQGELRADGLDIRHPSGKVVEIRVVAGRRAGGGLVAYWSAGVVFDEAPRMVGEDEGVVNFGDSRKAVLERLLPGAQLWAIGSPWAPIGPVYNTVQTHWGKPGGVLVVRAPAPSLNPVWWTPERCESAREADDEVFRMDVMGEWGTPETAMFSSPELDKVLRDDELPPKPNEFYSAAMDPATRGNAWTMVVGGKSATTGKPTIYAARQWIPGPDFTVRQVLADISEISRQYRLTHIHTDQWAADLIAELGRQDGVTIVDEAWTSKKKVEYFDNLRIMVRECDVQLMNAPHVRSDLLRVKRVLTASGASIRFPETADGRHCDYAPAIAMWANQPMREPDIRSPTDTYESLEERRMMEAEENDSDGKRQSPFRARRTR